MSKIIVTDGNRQILPVRNYPYPRGNLTMKKYSLTLNEGQMDCLIRLVQAGLNQCKTEAMHTTHLCTTVTDQPPTVEQVDNILDAFTRGHKLLALLEEHKALGPQPVYEEEEL